MKIFLLAFNILDCELDLVAIFNACAGLVKIMVHYFKTVTATENEHVNVDSRMKLRSLFIRLFDDTAPHVHTSQGFGEVKTPHWEPICSFLNIGNVHPWAGMMSGKDLSTTAEVQDQLLVDSYL